MKGVQNSPGDKEIFSWWGGAGNIFFVFHSVDYLIVNLWEHIFKNLLTLLKGLVLSPGDKEIISWWGGAGNIYFMFYAVYDLIGNLWKIYIKYFNFIERFGGFTRRPGDFLLVGWGWEYFFLWIDFQWEIRIVSWCFGWKSMKTIIKIF